MFNAVAVARTSGTDLPLPSAVRPAAVPHRGRTPYPQLLLDDRPQGLLCRMELPVGALEPKE
jgi:hypothetical protein